ncbi:hypothetical protein [Lysinibacillus sp. SGAir0095]|uniref:hypothetical protein n=1 Tax=Lysinibacillus sp. SGAir0095 TaxID=2070463 RepID=UPI0010CD2007|nr:hypothetical protein [Lysinibacillus sp. SGAir0095]QCR34275.1 hypothetical protein C1N55_20080 [Lysinibacillus sp. SGAir0095]
MKLYKQQVKSKKLYIKALIVVAALFIFIVSVKSIIDFLNTEEPQQLTVPEPASVDFRMYDDRTVEITKYELFYRDSSLYTKEAVEFFSLYETIEKFALFHYLDKFGYKIDEERIDSLRKFAKMTIEYDMKNTNLKAYYDKMFAELQITE